MNRKKQDLICSIIELGKELEEAKGISTLIIIDEMEKVIDEYVNELKN